MSQQTFHFFAPISNICGPADLVVFRNSIKPLKWKAQKIIRLLAELQDTENSIDAEYKIETSECLNATKSYGWVIHFFVDLEIDSSVEHAHDLRLIEQINKIDRDLENDFQLLRLLNGGSARMMGPFWYKQYPNNPALIFETVRDDIGIGKRTIITRKTISATNNFIHTTALPLKPDYLNLALESYNLSQEIHQLQLRFLSLMISLETLFNDNPQELSYRIMRNVSILLGKNPKHASEIATMVKDLYAKRSKLVHTGKMSNISEEDINSLEEIVRKAILAMHKCGKSKKELAEEFTAMGFGSWKA